MQEILLTRIFSVVTWYHFAFLAVSVAMFGITLGAVTVYLFRSRFSGERVSLQLCRNCICFSLSTILSCLAQIYLPFGALNSWSGIFWTFVVCLVISLPFFFFGICLAVIFSSRAAEIGRIYAADLAGAGLGCFLLPVLLKVIDGPSAVLANCSTGFDSRFRFWN